MDLFQAMKIFKRIAEIESFTKVADELGISQSSISKSVSALEGRLGVTLLNRSTRRLKLSDAGREYYERCRSILSDLEDTESSLAAGQSAIAGQIRVSVPDTLGRLRILPHIWNFLKRHPDVEMDILMEDRRVDLVQEGIDVAIRSADHFDPALITRKLCDIPRVLVASPAYLRQHGSPRAIDEIKTHDCIIYSLSPSGQTWGFVTPDGVKNLRVRGRVKVSSPEVALQAAQNGFGLSISPEWLAAAALTEGTLLPVLGASPPTSFAVHAVFPERRFIPARVRCFIDHLHKQLSDR